MSDSPQSMAMQPPPGGASGGKKGGPSNWWALAAAPIIAAMGHKLSGGKISFGDAMGSLGQGFAHSKLQQVQQDRERKFSEEGKFIDLAHKIVLEDLPKLDKESMQKYPSLQTLSQKYQEALSDGKGISAKEASDIVGYYNIAKHDMEQAMSEQKDREGSEDARRKASEGARNAEEAQYQTRMSGIGRENQAAGGGTPWSPENIQGHEQEMYGQTYGHIPTQVGGQTVRVPAEQAPGLLRIEVQKSKIEAAKKLAEKNLSARWASLGISKDRLGWQKQAVLTGQVNTMIGRMLMADETKDLPIEQVEAMAEQAVFGSMDATGQKMNPRPPMAGAQGNSPRFGNVTLK